MNTDKPHRSSFFKLGRKSDKQEIFSLKPLSMRISLWNNVEIGDINDHELKNKCFLYEYLYIRFNYLFTEFNIEYIKKTTNNN